jgi:hypothetical protein
MLQARLKTKPMLQGCVLNVIYSNVPDEIQNGINKAGQRTKDSTGGEIRNRIKARLDRTCRCLYEAAQVTTELDPSSASAIDRFQP